jgi:hypothetical protein
MHSSKRFDFLYHQLARAWDAHQSLRRSQEGISALAESSLRLNRARLAMSDWHSCDTLESH